ncbi:probable ATP-dependent RNA helicase DDX52 [Rhopilema esculentum]|uniref:probable ATP-dependent RNA helicase DDX52 n=1 Tax=Rhopilema esculentum TaxID=499914 RepID=UPI0031E2042F
MVDVHDIFKKLASGAQFSCRQDAFTKPTIQNLTQTKESHVNAIKSALDFFGTDEKSPGAENNQNHTEENAKKVKKRKIVNGNGSDEKDDDPIKDKKKKKKGSASVVTEKDEDIRREKVNRLRNQHGISIRGTDVPDPFTTFDELGERFKTPNYILQNVTDSGYGQPTPVQMQAIPLMLKQREVLACAPTGSGKTLAFIVPLLQSLQKPKRGGFRAVVISPTRELASQIYREFNRLGSGKGFRIHLLTKSKAASGNFTKTSDARYDILVATPNRLVYLLSKDPPGISLDKVEWLVLDEGDKLFEDGVAGFRDQIATIFRACDNPKIKRALFSATLANDVEQWCQLHLDNFVRVVVGVRNAATETVKQELKFVGQESGKLLAMRDLLQKGFLPPILVFVQSKERAKELFNELIYDGINVDVIHADRTQAQRDNIVKSFRTGKIWVLIATDLMGRGIDFKGVNLVVNYDFPSSAVSYIHRIGRTGRAGRPGTAVTFFTEDDVVNIKSISNVMAASGCEIPTWISELKNPNRAVKRKLKKIPVERESIASLTRIDKARRKPKKSAESKTVNAKATGPSSKKQEKVGKQKKKHPKKATADEK